MELTKKILQEMTTENTGTHFLDSGGQAQYDDEEKYCGSINGYGRNWERNENYDPRRK